MHMRVLLMETRKLAEAVRPTHVLARIGQQAADPMDIAHTAANHIESGIDDCLSRNLTTDKYVQIRHTQGRVAAKIMLRWSVLTNQVCSVRIGLDSPLAYFPAPLIDSVRNMIVTFYQDEGWTVRIDDNSLELSHSE
jgi:hypothetical protein